jgi:hypothetical protein
VFDCLCYLIRVPEEKGLSDILVQVFQNKAFQFIYQKKKKNIRHYGNAKWQQLDWMADDNFANVAHGVYDLTCTSFVFKIPIEVRLHFITILLFFSLITVQDSVIEFCSAKLSLPER